MRRRAWGFKVELQPSAGGGGRGAYQTVRDTACPFGAAAVNDALSQSEYLVENRFMTTHIIMGYAVNWGQKMDLINGLGNLKAHLDRFLARAHCALS